MTAKSRLVPKSEVEKHITSLRAQGIQIGTIDIRSDGVTIYPPGQTPKNDFDKWKAQSAR